MISGRLCCAAALLAMLAGVTVLRSYTHLTLPTFLTRRFSNTLYDSQPHIIYVMADDLGWNDVGYHGSVVQTPTIDRLAAEGVKLERFYVQPVCTPSRACLMTGKYITHTGLQHRMIAPKQLNALTLNATILPQVLRQLGYKNYMVGKWHLGFYAKQYLPEQRGFDKFFGILPGQAGHYNRLNTGHYSLVENGKPYWENLTYSTHLYVQKTIEYVEQHLKDHPEKPMFLFVSFQAVHAPIQVPSSYSDIYNGMDADKVRRGYAGMATAMDEGIKNITELYKQRGIWDNTVLFFSTDNGGIVKKGGSNRPLRDGKGTLYDGGIRGVAFAHGRGIKPATVSHGLMHISDIFPTIVHLAQQTSALGQRIFNNLQLDGVDMSNMLARGGKSPRKEILVNIDPLAPIYGSSLFPDIYDTRVRSAIITDQWKLITGNPIRYFDKKAPPISQPSVQLYDLYSDPAEQHNLASSRLAVVRKLLARLQFYNMSAIGPYYPDRKGRWAPDDVFLPYDDNPEHLV